MIRRFPNFGPIHSHAAHKASRPSTTTWESRYIKLTGLICLWQNINHASPPIDCPHRRLLHRKVSKIYKYTALAGGQLNILSVVPARSPSSTTATVMEGSGAVRRKIVVLINKNAFLLPMLSHSISVWVLMAGAWYVVNKHRDKNGATDSIFFLRVSVFCCW